MLTTRHAVDLAYTRPELEALFRYAHAHDAERGGTYDARSAAINVWSHHWQHPATDEGFSLEDLMAELGRLELRALGRMKHGHVPQEGSVS
jgi:hypothetical protein